MSSYDIHSTNDQWLTMFSRVDLMQLVEEAVDGCWIGHRARTAIMEDTGIGSVYSPPKEDETKSRKHVEAVVDIGERQEVCEIPWMNSHGY